MTHTSNQNPYASLDHSDEVLALYIDRVNTAMLEELRLAYPGGKIPQRALLKAALPKIERAAAALLYSYSMAIDFYDWK